MCRNTSCHTARQPCQVTAARVLSLKLAVDGVAAPKSLLHFHLSSQLGLINSFKSRHHFRLYQVLVHIWEVIWLLWPDLLHHFKQRIINQKGIHAGSALLRLLHGRHLLLPLPLRLNRLHLSFVNQLLLVLALPKFVDADLELVLSFLSGLLLRRQLL